MKRKILAITTAALMLITSNVFAENNGEDKIPEYEFNQKFAENYKVNEMPKFSDETELSKEVDLLIRLNIISGYDDGTLKLERTITRAEASKMFCYAINSATTIEDIENQYSKEGIEQTKKDYAIADIEFEYNGFEDVALESWYHPYVYAAKNLMNCISGYEDGTFRPENTVSEIEFLTMLERALGYSDMIEAEGGFPDGVIAISNRLKLIDNPSNLPATRGRAAIMLYNAIHSHIVMIDRYVLNESGVMEAQFSLTQTILGHRHLSKVHGTIKKSSVLPEKTIVFVPDNDTDIKKYAEIMFRLEKGKEYTFVKEYSDISDGEHDVYIDYSYGKNVIVKAAL